jgi:ribonuclease HI
MSENNKKLKEVTLYTDGCSLGNPGPGGYGAVLIYNDNQKEITGGYRLTTNNRMELKAVIEGLKALKEKCNVDVYSDSQYVVNAFQKGWIFNWKSKNWKRRKREIPNTDLWKELLDLYNYHHIKFNWIRGHNGVPENERCDKLSKQAAQQEDLPIDRGYKK